MWEKKSKETTKCEKITITCNVETAQCDDGTVKCEKKVRGPPNMRKKTVTCDKNRTDALLVLFNITIEPSNLRKKNKGTTICDKKNRQM